MADLRSGLVLALAAVALAGCGHHPKLNIPEGPLGTNMNEVHDIDTDGILRMGQRLENADDVFGAANFYADAIARDPQRIEGHLGMARVLDRAGQTAQAAVHYGHAIAIDPDNGAAIRGYAKDKIMIGRPAEALDAITRFMERNPAAPELLNYQGVAMDLLGRNAEAARAYRQGLQITGGDASLRDILLGNLALSLGLGGEYSEAILLLNPYVGDMRYGLESMTESQSVLRQNLALVYALSGNPEAAVEVAKSALSEDDAEHNREFYEAIGALTGPARARAVFFGELPEGR